MKIPVYLCTTELPDDALGRLRNWMVFLCRERWLMESEADLQTLTPEALRCDLRRFQRERRVEAEKRAIVAQKPFYVLSDDDTLIAHPDPFLPEAVQTMREHPEFAILSLWPSNSVLGKWKADDLPGYEPYEDDEVMEHVSVGGIRICRTGAVPLAEWPEMHPKLWSYDAQQGTAFRDAGYRVGYLKRKPGQDYPAMNHLGRHFSLIWPKPPE